MGPILSSILMFFVNLFLSERGLEDMSWQLHGVLLLCASHEPTLIFHISVRTRQVFSLYIYIYMKGKKPINHLDVVVYLCINMYINRALQVICIK